MKKWPVSVWNLIIMNFIIKWAVFIMKLNITINNARVLWPIDPYNITYSNNELLTFSSQNLVPRARSKQWYWMPVSELSTMLCGYIPTFPYSWWFTRFITYYKGNNIIFDSDEVPMRIACIDQVFSQRENTA